MTDSNHHADVQNGDGKTRILFVDDHALVREGLAELVNGQADLQACGESEDVKTAFRLIVEKKPDLVIVDLMLGNGGNGLELIKQVAAREPSIKMLVCSMCDEALYAERALRSGASGYVSKQEPSRVVLEAIRTVIGGRTYVSDEIAERIQRRPSKAATEERPRAVDSLSDRELEVLDLLGDGWKTKQIAEHLELSTKTIDTYREHLKTKLGLRNAYELLRFAVARKLDPDNVPDPGTSSD